MISRINILLVCILVASMLFIPGNRGLVADEPPIWKGMGLYDGGPANYIYGNPGFSTAPDVVYLESDDTIQAGWVDTYDDGKFMPAYSRFNRYSWRNANYVNYNYEDTHWVDAPPPHTSITTYDYSSGYPPTRIENHYYGESVTQVKIAPNHDIHPIMVAGWIFNDPDYMQGTQLCFIDLNSTQNGWGFVSTTENHKKDFDLCYDNEGIYLTWLEWNNKFKQYQVMVSYYEFYSYPLSIWKRLPGDTTSYPHHPSKVTANDNPKFSPTVQCSVDPNTGEKKLILCWEEDTEIKMVEWDFTPASGGSGAAKGWKSIEGVYGEVTNISKTPDLESHEPDFAIDPDGNPIAVWTEATIDGKMNLVYSKWSGSRWTGLNSLPGFSIVYGGTANDDPAAPKIAISPDNLDRQVITCQLHSNNENNSFITIKDGQHFYDLSGIKNGFTAIRPGGNETYTSDVTPYVTSDDKVMLSGVTTPTTKFFGPQQTNIFIQKLDKDIIQPPNNIEYEVRIINSKPQMDWNEGWFPINKTDKNGDPKNVLVEYKIKLNNIDDVLHQYFYMHFNTVVRFRKFTPLTINGVDVNPYDLPPIFSRMEMRIKEPPLAQIPPPKFGLYWPEYQFNELEYDPAPVLENFPDGSFRRPMEWFRMNTFDTHMDVITSMEFIIQVEYSDFLSDTYSQFDEPYLGTNPPSEYMSFEPTADPPFYYTHMFTAFDPEFYPPHQFDPLPEHTIPPRVQNLPTNPYPNQFDVNHYHNFVGFNAPYEEINLDNLFVTPDFRAVNVCKPVERFNIALHSPWGEGVDFTYELEILNESNFRKLNFSFGNQVGNSSNGTAKTFLAVRADCDAPLGWYYPKIRVTFTRKDNPGVFYGEKDISILTKVPKLYGSKIANTSMAAAGDIVIYTITVGNEGTGTAYDVEIVDLMPRDLQFLYSSYPGNETPSGVTFSFKEIPSGAQYKIKVFCRIRSDTKLKTGYVLTNTVTITGIDKRLSASMGITVRTASPGCETPEIEMIIDKHAQGKSIEAGEEFDCKMLVHKGCNPFDVVIFWDDNSKSDRFEIGSAMQHDFTHTYDDAGDYLVRISVADEFGKMVNVYKHIHVKNK